MRITSFLRIVGCLVKSTLRTIASVPAGPADLGSVKHPGHVFEYAFNGLGHGNAESPSDPS